MALFKKSSSEDMLTERKKGREGGKEGKREKNIDMRSIL